MKIKRTFFYAFLIPAFFSCMQGSDKSAAVKTDTTHVTVLTFLNQADSLVDQPVIIEGVVLHTCKHGGKRMFLVDGGTDSLRVEITTGENIAKFDEALIGSRVSVFGTLREERIDTRYLNEWEAELKKPAENHEAGIHSGAKGHEDQGTEDKLATIRSLREELKNSGKDHLSNFSIEANRFTVIK